MFNANLNMIRTSAYVHVRFAMNANWFRALADIAIQMPRKIIQRCPHRREHTRQWNCFGSDSDAGHGEIVFVVRIDTA